MPFVSIDTRRGRTAAQKQALLDATHAALTSALKIPGVETVGRILEHDPDTFTIPPTRGDGYVLVQVKLFAGRTSETKRELYRALIDNLAAAGVPPQDVTIILDEVDRDNWAIRDGQPASDVQLGFNIQV